MRFLPALIFLACLACGIPVAAQTWPAFGQETIRRPQPMGGQRSGPQIVTSPANNQARKSQQAEQLYRTGRRFIEQGFYSEGLEALNQSLALRPNYPRALTYKGIALRALREPQLALQQFNEALAAEPQDGVAHGERGLTYIMLGEKEKAKPDLQAAAKLRPDLVPWFTQQSKWMSANQIPGTLQNQTAQQAGVVDQQQTAASSPGTEQNPVPADPGPSATDTNSPGSAASSFDWAGAFSLIKPALFVAVGLLTLLLFLRLAFYLAGKMWRLFSRPWQSRLHIRPANHLPSSPSSNEGTLNPLGHPEIMKQPAFAETISRLTFWRRHRGLLISAGIGLAVLTAVAAPALIQAFQLDAEKLIEPRVRPSVLDFRGKVYTHLGAPDTPVQYSDLPVHLVDALRAREDSRFFEHHGVDWLGILRAFVADLRHLRIKQGASTLTMQLVEKAYHLDQEGPLNRIRSKFVEWIMAHRGEAALTQRLGSMRAAKEAILVAYLNRVEFGSGTVGIGSASLFYFNKPVSKLSLGESCMLVALLRAPTANSPYRNPDNARMARDKIVTQMLRRGYITEEQSKEARFYVVENPKKPKPQHNGYLVAAVSREINALKAEGKVPAGVWDYEALTIHTTLDLWAQEILDSEVRKVIAAYKGDTESDPLAGAAMVVENATGQIRAVVSGQDYSKNQYDLAFSSRRQVASIAKPFVYAAYLEEGGSIDEVVSNAALSAPEIRELHNWNPHNSSSLKVGNYPISSGLAYSDNNITVRVGLKAGLDHVYDILYKAGLVSDKTTTGSTWLLGTFESSLARVVSAYTAIPRGGSRIAPYLVQSVEIEGKTVYRATSAATPFLSKNTCQQLDVALQQTMTEGTGKSASKNVRLNTSVAGKTGTSQNSADVWWVGYVKQVTLGIRYGRNSNASLGNAAAGGTLAAPVAIRVLERLSERYQLDSFAGEDYNTPAESH